MSSSSDAVAFLTRLVPGGLEWQYANAKQLLQRASTTPRLRYSLKFNCLVNFDCLVNKVTLAEARSTTPFGLSRSSTLMLGLVPGISFFTK